jgi:organic radical activating enzyme
MNSKNVEFIQFRDQVIDPISPSFCAAKWYNATIWLGAGMTASCHLPPAHSIPLKELKKSYKALHNTEHKKNFRKMMLKGERPSECEYCWKIEDLGEHQISDRVLQSKRYSVEDIKALPQVDPAAQEDIELKTLEISFDRTCNFSCSYCNPAFSSTWVKDIIKHGPYKGLKSDGQEHYDSTADWGQVYKADEDNPYLQAFWQWWPELSKSLQELRITGGEPLLSPHVWKLMNWLTSPENTDLKLDFAINTNLGVKSALIEDLINYSHQIKNMSLYTSGETVGSHAEYIRDGLNYKTWQQMVEKTANEGQFKQVHIMMTVNALALFKMSEFLDWVVQIKRDFKTVNFSVNILRFPAFQSAAVLPKSTQKNFSRSLNTWLKDNFSELNPRETVSLQRLIDYLNEVDTPHSRASGQKKLRHDFIKFYDQYDQRRQKSFLQTFGVSPEEMLSE